MWKGDEQKMLQSLDIKNLIQNNQKVFKLEYKTLRPMNLSE